MVFRVVVLAAEVLAVEKTASVPAPVFFGAVGLAREREVD